MSWKKYFQIISIIIIALMGFYLVTPKYSFNTKGTRRKNIFTGKVEVLIGQNTWMTPEEYQHEMSELDSRLKSMPPHNSDADVWIPVNSQN